MVFKRPYAFLIKHFKIIHLIFLAIILFITYSFSRIVNIFSAYAKYNTVSSNSFSSVTLFILFLLIIVAILFTVLMWRLMSQKKKPYKYYLFAGVYYLLILIAFIYAFNTINDLETISLTQKASRAYRDIYEILLIPNFYFIIISFIRSIGFDIKRFNFGKDLEELEINKNDNEEVEFVLGNDTYKLKRKIRRSLREFKYYFLENKIFISIIGGSVLLIILLALLINYTFFKKIYKVGDKLKTEDFTYILNNAYISSYDYSGKVIKDNKKYLILDFNIKNNGISREIKPENFYINLNNNILNFKTTLSNSFSDLGQSYNNSKINSEYDSYLFIYEIDSSYRGKYFNLNVFDKIKFKDNDVEYIFKQYKIKAQNLDKKFQTEESDLDNKIILNESLYGNTNVVIKKVEVKTSYEYKYNICTNETNCYESYDIELPTNSNKNSLLIIEYQLEIDKNNQISKIINNDNTFFDKFLKIENISNNKIFTSSIATHKNDRLNNIIIADISKNIQNSENINIAISTRTNKYLIKLK